MQTYIPLQPDLAAWLRSVLQSSLTPAEKNCAVALLTFVDDRLCLAWPSGKGEQEARSAVRRLEDLGLIASLEALGQSERVVDREMTEGQDSVRK